MKNNKGFTLVELLAVIVVLGVVLTIVIRSVVVSIDEAKKKTEKVFVNKLEAAIDQYIDLDKKSFVKDTSFETKKIKKNFSSDGQPKDVNIIKLLKRNSDGSTRNINFSDILSTGFIKKNDFVNPANEDVECKEETIINIYRDEDFVYYYQTDLNCISDENTINILPSFIDEESGEEE